MVEVRCWASSPRSELRRPISRLMSVRRRVCNATCSTYVGRFGRGLRPTLRPGRRTFAHALGSALPTLQRPQLEQPGSATVPINPSSTAFQSNSRDSASRTLPLRHRPRLLSSRALGLRSDSGSRICQLSIHRRRVLMWNQELREQIPTVIERRMSSEMQNQTSLGCARRCSSVSFRTCAAQH